MATQNSTLVLPPSGAERVEILERKYHLGRLINHSAQDLLNTAADIAANSTLPADKVANEQALRMYLRRASNQLTARAAVSTAKAQARYDAILWMPWTTAQAENRAAAERKLTTARDRAYVAREQADLLFEQVFDTLIDAGAITSDTLIGDLPDLLRAAAV